MCRDSRMRRAADSDFRCELVPSRWSAAIGDWLVWVGVERIIGDAAFAALRWISTKCETARADLERTSTTPTANRPGCIERVSAAD